MTSGIYKRKPFTKKHKENMSIAVKKRWENSEYRKSRIEKTKKLWQICEYREKQRKSHIGNKSRLGAQNSKETKIKISEAMKGKYSGKNHPNWQGGISFEPYSPEFNNDLKEKIRERDNRICQKCNKTEREIGRKLTIHHIDFNKKNNNPKNLISLCVSCNGKVNFNRKYWINYFKEKMECDFFALFR